LPPQNQKNQENCVYVTMVDSDGDSIVESASDREDDSVDDSSNDPDDSNI